MQHSISFFVTTFQVFCLNLLNLFIWFLQLYGYIYYWEDLTSGANQICLTRSKYMCTKNTIFIAFLKELSWIKHKNRDKPAKYLDTWL